MMADTNGLAIAYRSPCPGGDLYVWYDNPLDRDLLHISTVNNHDVYLNVDNARAVADQLQRWADDTEKRNERNTLANATV